MGKRTERKLSLTGISSDTSLEELKDLAKESLEEGIHGLFDEELKSTTFFKHKSEKVWFRGQGGR